MLCVTTVLMWEMLLQRSGHLSPTWWWGDFLHTSRQYTHWTQHSVFPALWFSAGSDRAAGFMAEYICRADKQKMMDGGKHRRVKFSPWNVIIYMTETHRHRKFLVFNSPVTISVVKQFVSVQRIQRSFVQRDKLQNWVISSVLPRPQVEDE